MALKMPAFSFPKHITMISILALTFTIIPFLPYSVTMWADNIVVRILLLLLFIGAVYVHPLVGLVMLMNIGLLFISRNKSKVDVLGSGFVISKPTDEAIVNIQTPETAPPQPEYMESETIVHEYKPSEDSGDNSFKPVGVTINEKFIPDTTSSHGSQKALEQILG
jgi:hypothetical protein